MILTLPQAFVIIDSLNAKVYVLWFKHIGQGSEYGNGP